MHPDRRRQGRAIRKQRRLEQQAALEALPQILALFEALSGVVGSVLEGMGRAFTDVGRSMQAPPGQNRIALPPSPGALRLPEGGVLSPTRAGVEAAREAHSASPSERVDAAAAALGLELMPWQREVAEIYLSGGRLHLARGRSGGYTTVKRVIEQAERDPQAEMFDHGGWEDH